MIKLLLFAIPSMAGIVLQLTGYTFSEALILPEIYPIDILFDIRKCLFTTAWFISYFYLLVFGTLVTFVA